MKIVFVSLFLCFVLNPSLYAEPENSTYFKSCGDIYRTWLEYKKSDNGLNYSSYDVAFFIGYVIGHAEAYSYMAANVTKGGKGWPEGTTTGQIMLIFGKYLEGNPEELSPFLISASLI